MKHRAISLVVASLPAVCEVCGGYRSVEFRDVRWPEEFATPCPHCWWDIPIAPLPFRTDLPRSAA